LQCNSALLWSQTEPEDIKLDADQFQELFSNLNAKGIENYDKAIEALEKPINSNQMTLRYIMN
jgi:hypothetical protein